MHSRPKHGTSNPNQGLIMKTLFVGIFSSLSLLLGSGCSNTPTPYQDGGVAPAAGLPGEAIDPAFASTEFPYDGDQDPGPGTPNALD